MGQHTKCKNLEITRSFIFGCFTEVVVNEYTYTVVTEEYNLVYCILYGYMSVVDSCESCPFSNTRIRVYRTSSQLFYFPKDTRIIEQKTAFSLHLKNKWIVNTVCTELCSLNKVL